MTYSFNNVMKNEQRDVGRDMEFVTVRDISLNTMMKDKVLITCSEDELV